jgi:hypothetical protein
MSQDMESILRKSLDDVDRSQKWQIAGLGFFLIFLVAHTIAFITAVHAGDQTSAPNARALANGIISAMLMVGVCTFGITFFISRMTKRILKAIELSSKP